MKVHFLPHRQELRNNEVIGRLRRVGVSAWILILAALSTASWLYLAGPPIDLGTQILSADSTTVIGDAVLVSPQLVLASGEGVADVLFVSKGQRTLARRVRTATMASGAVFSLYRLEHPSPAEPATPSVAEEGQRLTSASSGLTWQGTLTKSAQPKNELTVEPDFSLPSGAVVYLDGEKDSIIGIAAQIGSRVAVCPITTILLGFPELSGSR